MNIDFDKLLYDSYVMSCEIADCEHSKWEFVSSGIFDLITYDSGLDELLGNKMMEVILSIRDGNTYDYIADDQNYIWFIKMCNTPFLGRALEWGTSIRGAWFDQSMTYKIDTCSLFYDGKQIVDPILSYDDLISLINALEKFLSEEMKILGENK